MKIGTIVVGATLLAGVALLGSLTTKAQQPTSAAAAVTLDANAAQKIDKVTVCANGMASSRGCTASRGTQRSIRPLPLWGGGGQAWLNLATY